MITSLLIFHDNVQYGSIMAHDKFWRFNPRCYPEDSLADVFRLITVTAALMVVFCVLRFHEVPELWHERMTLVNETLQEKQAVGKIDHL